MNEPWFARRSVGIGWRPVAWQGWAVMVVAIVALVSLIIFFRVNKSPVGFVIVPALVGLYMLAAATSRRHQPKKKQPTLDTQRDGSARDARTEAATRHAATAASLTAVAPVRRLTEGAVTPLPRRAETQQASASQPALIVQSLTKRFGDRVAFEDVSFTVAAGEVFGFLGPNGAGKTTTVRTLGTLIAPTAGSATVIDIPLLPENGQAIRQRIAIMPEAPGLYLRLSVRENLEYFAGLFGVPDARRRIDGALDAVNLGARSEDLCGSLSKGLRQRVALARALLSDPAVLFLDEPTSGLDPVAARDVHALIDALRRRGVTIFLTTHRLDEAERLCDRVAILNTTLRMVGRPDELRARLFRHSLVVATASPLPAPDTLFADINGLERWETDDAGRYVLTVSDPKTVAPALTRALVAGGADVLEIAERQHSLEDVYLELISDDIEVRPE